MNQAQKKTAMDYLSAYVAAQDADLHFEQAIKIQFGGNADRWTHGEMIRSNPETFKAFLAKVNADHEKARLLSIMRECGASLADLDPESVEM